MQARIKFKREAARMKAQAEAMGIEAEITIKRTKIRYTFMAWDSHVLPLYPNGYGDDFPALLTKRAGIDYSVIDWMIPLFDKGIKGNALSDDWLVGWLVGWLVCQ